MILFGLWVFFLGYYPYPTNVDAKLLYYLTKLNFDE